MAYLMAIEARPGDLSDPRILALLRAHLKHAYDSSPPDSVYALDTDGLSKPEVTLWSFWDADELIGFGALKQNGPQSGEIKSMHAVSNRRGLGIGSHILKHIIQTAKARGYTLLELETGSNEAYALPAHCMRNTGF